MISAKGFFTHDLNIANYHRHGQSDTTIGMMLESAQFFKSPPRAPIPGPLQRQKQALAWHSLLAFKAVLVNGQVFFTAVAVHVLFTFEDQFYFARVEKHLHLRWGIVVNLLEDKAKVQPQKDMDVKRTRAHVLTNTQQNQTPTKQRFKTSIVLSP